MKKEKNQATEAAEQKQPVKNVDLWKRLIAAVEPHDVVFHWVRGHAGHPENERCDRLAVAAREARPLPEDLGYEAGVTETTDTDLTLL